MKRKSLKPIKNLLYIKFFNKIRINLLIIPLFYSALKFNFLEFLFISYTTALFHEFFHIFSMKFLNVPYKRIDIEPFGICAELQDVSIFNSYKEIFIALSGPLYNFISALFLSFISKNIDSIYIDYAIKINLLMGIFNLLPALPLDGGRILRAFLSINFGIIKAYNFTLRLSNRIIFIIILFGIIIIFFAPFNFSLILIGAFLFSNLTKEAKCLNHIILKDILSKKEEMDTKNIKNTKVLTVFEDSPARKVLKHLSFDYVLYIVILSRTGKIIKCAGESEILELLFKSGIRSKFSDVK